MISTPITSTVTLGSGIYLSPLTITGMGAIIPATAGATALYGPAGIAGASIVNQGSITGATGAMAPNDGQTPGGAGGFGVDLLAAGTLTNSGLISGGTGGGAEFDTQPGGAGGIGANLASGGMVTNAGTILGGNGGNGGFVVGPGKGADGIDMASAGTLTNTGTILGGSGGQNGSGNGVEFTSSGSLSNAGIITGGSGYRGGAGVVFAGDALTNAGVISGGSGGAPSFGGGGDGVVLASTGALTNTGTIAGGGGNGGGIGVDMTSGGRLTNTGTVTGGSRTTTGGIATEPDGVGVYLNGGTLINAGTIAGGADTGAATVSAAVQFGTNAATLVVDPGAMFIGQVVANAAAADVLELSGTRFGTFRGLGTQVGNFASIVFDPEANWFVAGNTTGLAGTINGFAFGDTIELDGVTATGSNYSGGILTLNEAAGSATLDLPGSFTTGQFVVTNGAAGTDVSLACFAAGTHIRTTRGDIPVEYLAVGDVVPTAPHGGAAPIVWIGHRNVRCTGHPRPGDVWPVRIAANAFGPGTPMRDLRLSPGHAVYVDGVLVPIRCLINGTSIAQVPVHEIVYYHLALPAHDLVLAEGLATESYLDLGDRSNFVNGGDAVRMFPDFAGHAADARWETLGCARIIMTGPELNAVRESVNAIAEGLAASDAPARRALA